MFIGLKEHEKRARVHFIPALKDGVFVTLRAPEVINVLYFVGYFVSYRNLVQLGRYKPIDMAG